MIFFQEIILGLKEFIVVQRCQAKNQFDEEKEYLNQQAFSHIAQGGKQKNLVSMFVVTGGNEL